jgi:hypothetical protein
MQIRVIPRVIESASESRQREHRRLKRQLRDALEHRVEAQRFPEQRLPASDLYFVPIPRRYRPRPRQIDVLAGDIA